MTLLPNLETILNQVNNFINIDTHRQIYTNNFNHLRNVIFEGLRQNEVFAYMFNGFQLAGSYGDNAKVSIPDEFDLVFHITFPEQSLIDVTKDEELPGNVFLDFTKVLNKIANEKQHVENLKHLKQWLDDKNFLKVEKFQCFIQSCFRKVLLNMENKITFNGKTFHLHYKREGPAHTIIVKSWDIKYSVDFVPGILLSPKQCVIPNMDVQWEAIPKPSLTYDPKYNSFRSSYYQQELRLIKDKYQLKNAYRMMKKFRDTKTNMNKMKSYFIKTLFLHKANKENTNYWTKPLATILIDMFKDMEESLREKNLPFFWNHKLNLYKKYSFPLINAMLSCVESTRETLEKAAANLTITLQKRVYSIFLNAAELYMLEQQSIDVDQITTNLKKKLNLNTTSIEENEDDAFDSDDDDDDSAQIQQNNAEKSSCTLL